MTAETIETMREAITRLQRHGYLDDFRACADGLEALATKRIFSPEDLTVDEVVRFEGMTSPDDEAIVFALRAKDGLKGTYTVPYGPSMAPRDVEAVQRLDRHPERR